MKRPLQFIFVLLAASAYANAPEQRSVLPTHGIGGLLSRSQHSATNTQHAYYHADGNGNITAMVDESQNVVASYKYDSFGNAISASGDLAEANVYRFSSKEFHASSGLYCYSFRCYAPTLQRWPNRDPIQERGGLNLYTCVANNPINRYDLLGLACGDWWDPRSYFQGGLNGIWHVLYTGSATSSDEVYDSATEEAGDYVYENGGVRGGYAGIGYGGKAKGRGAIAGAAGLTGTWTIDDGAALSLDAGVGLQDRGRNSSGRFTSQTIGVGGGYEFWNEKDGLQSPREGTKFGGMYGGTAENGKVYKGGANYGVGTGGNVSFGINYGPAYAGLIVDPDRVFTNFRDSFNILFH